MLSPMCIPLAFIAISCLPAICGDTHSQSTMTGYSGEKSYIVHSSSMKVNGRNVQQVWIEGNGISENVEYVSASDMSLSVFNKGGMLVVMDPANDKFLLFSDKPGFLVIMKDGVCTEKSYSAGTSSTSKQLSDGQCQAIRRRASDELEKNRVYWDQWSKDLNKNMQDSFPPGFPFHNQQRNSAPPMPLSTGNLFQGLANMQKNIFSGFRFNRR